MAEAVNIQDLDSRESKERVLGLKKRIREENYPDKILAGAKRVIQMLLTELNR